MNQRTCNVLLSAVGRRPYLVRWFQDALRSSGAAGKVIAADADPYAASRGASDLFLHAPPAADPSYPEWLRRTLERHEISLALSINDYELSTWAGLSVDTWQRGGSLIRLTPQAQQLVEDKYLLAQALSEADAPSPPTWLGTEVLSDPTIVSGESKFVVKPRFGSGSAQVTFVAHDGLKDAVQETALRMQGADGALLENDPSALVVQPQVPGAEYGLDLVSDFSTNLSAVLVRKKLSMRSGETDKAITENSARFWKTGELIAAVTQHRGSIDVDVLEDTQGKQWVIDVNPRFGGGYPFSHAAGADIPQALVLWALGEDAPSSLFEYTVGTVSAKSVDIVRLGGDS